MNKKISDLLKNYQKKLDYEKKNNRYQEEEEKEKNLAA